MILLDTDHLSVLQVPSSDRRTRLVARLALAVDEVVGTTIVSVEEQMAWFGESGSGVLYGRLAIIHFDGKPAVELLEVVRR